MRDRKGRKLMVGDTVLIPVKLTVLYPVEDYCNVCALSVFGRRPDDAKESFGAINTAVTPRANEGNENDLAEIRKEAGRL